MFKILVVDGEPETREAYRAGLAAAGYTVETASDSAGALRLVQDWEPDLAVLDVKLGRESGLDLLRHALELRRSLATILVSAYPGYRDDFTTWLADAFIDKSRDADVLTSKVRELLAPTAA
jgi:DNA-binding response OmpR family regulator